MRICDLAVNCVRTTFVAGLGNGISCEVHHPGSWYLWRGNTFTLCLGSRRWEGMLWMVCLVRIRRSSSSHMPSIVLVSYSGRGRGVSAIGQSIGSRGNSCTTSLCYGVWPTSRCGAWVSWGLCVLDLHGLLQSACSHRECSKVQLAAGAVIYARGRSQCWREWKSTNRICHSELCKL